MKLLPFWKNLSLMFGTLLFIAACSADSGSAYKTVDALHRAIASASPGDTLVVANGEWVDADLLFEAEGTAESPIVLIAEEPGEVIFTGASRLRLAGEHLVVNGLAFINGHTPGATVIEFRKNSKKLANNSRVTNCVIDNYNPADRYKRDMWVTLYGKNNRFDHNTLTNKKNSGVTLVVRLNDPRSQENNHRIDHNFFGYRPRLGSNGGETLRVGVSTYSLSSSNTVIEDNYFYKCNGETEVASIKASDNIVRRNTFYECEGSLVMRHGDRNIVSENFFIGNDLPETGGVRVINNGHKIYNNYFYGLKGERFRAALAVMNGVPNSLLNRYHKAKDCIIANNTFINCDNVELGVGSDFERTDVPENILIANNIFLHERSNEIYQTLDDISGISFKTNVAFTRAGPYRSSGFLGINPDLKKVGDGLFVPTASSIAGIALQSFDFLKTDITGKNRSLATAGALQLDNAAEFRPYATKDNTGVKWYNSKSDAVAFGSGDTHAVATGEELAAAVENSAPGDVVELSTSGDYNLEETLVIEHPLTIRAKAGLNKR
ncbi:MAG: polysaccharide lyase 6 family protein, partial [Calditrichota bacterium]